jgi:mono/diheme cytochrome c family protein
LRHRPPGIVRHVAVVLTSAGAVVAVSLAVSACGGGSSSSSSATTVASGVDGRAVYANNCARCHGTTGQGGVGPKLSAPALKKQFADIRTQILFVSQGSGVMPAFGTTLSPSEIQAVVAYTRTLNPGG